MNETEEANESGEEATTVNHRLLELHLCKGKILVWNADDVKLLRETHHIVGALVGSLPRSPRQNVQLSLPLQLMPEEAAVLIEYDVAKLVNIKIAKRSADDVSAFEQTRRRSFQEQQVLWDTQNLKKKQDLAHVIVTGRASKKLRRAERAKRQKREKGASLVNSRGGSSAGCPPDGAEVARKDSKKRMEEDEDAVAMAMKPQEDLKEHGSVAGCDRPSNTDQSSSKQFKFIAWSKENSDKDAASNAVTEPSSSQGGHELASDPCTDESCRTHLTESKPSESLLLRESNSSFSIKTSEAVSVREKGMPSAESDSESERGSLGASTQNPSTDNEVNLDTDDSERLETFPLTASVAQECQEQSRVLRPVSFEDRGQLGTQGDSDGARNTAGQGAFSLTTQEVKSDESDIFKRPPDPQPCSGYLVHIVTASPTTPRQEVTEWAFPTTGQEQLRYRVFRDLWETGYYLTSGCKFGGDFLVYPGDPFLYHSYFIAICVPHDKMLSPLELITYSRLGTNVKKTVILCSVDESDEVVYTSLQWTGIS